MVANDDFFQRPQAAAVLKHGILSRYSTVFATMAGKRTGAVVYFDGYAGPGRYDDGSPGSPLLAVETAKQTAKWGRDVKCLFVEQNRRFAKNLEEVLAAEAPEGMVYRVWQGDVAEHVGAALEFAGDEPMLTFLDPFGTALDYTTLTGKLLARRADQPTEVLLNLNLEMVSRIGGLLARKTLSDGDERTLGRLDTFFGDGWWRAAFRSVHKPGVDGSAAEAAQHVAGQFLARVKMATGFDCFGVPVRRRPKHQPLFLLLLLYRTDIAPWKFNESVSSANGDWRAACWEADVEGFVEELLADPAFFGTNTADLAREAEWEAWKAQQTALEKEWIGIIAGNLQRLLTASPKVRLAADLRGVYGDVLGLARDKHVNKAWDAMADAGLAEPRPKSQRLEYATIVRAAPTTTP